MSKFNSKGTHSLTGELLSGLTAEQAKRGKDFSVSTESAAFTLGNDASPAARDIANRDFKSVVAEIKSLAEGSNMPVTNIGLESAAIIKMMLGDKAGTRTFKARPQIGTENLNTFSALPAGSFGEIDNNVSLESFDQRNIEKHSLQSIAYNLVAPRQDELGELFYPTIVGTPDEAYYKVQITRSTVYQGAQHNPDGSVTKFEKVNLLDAYRDHTVLLNECTRLVPYASDDAEKQEYFAPKATIANTIVKVGEFDVPTRPLALNKRFDMLGLASHPGLVSAGLLAQNDMIDHNVRVAALWVKVSKTGETDQYIRYDTLRMSQNQWVHSREEQSRDLTLRFNPRSLLVDASVKDHAGAELTALAGFRTAGLSMYLSSRVDGDLNVETGETEVRATSTRIEKIVDATGKELKTHASLTGVTFTPVWWEFDGRLTNANRRTRGMLMDTDLYSEVYLVGLLAPIVLHRPTSNDNGAVDTDALINATHVQISNNAVTTMLNYAEILKRAYNRVLAGERTASIYGEGFVEGIGRMVVMPWFESVTVDMKKVLGNLTSADKLSDIRGYFIGLMTEIAYRAAQESGYLPVLRQFTGNPKAKPKVLIGTDQVLPQFMMLNGDDRSFGPKLDFEVASTPDNRFTNKIIGSFGGISGDFSPLNFGNMIWIPEAISTIPVFRQGATVEETMVQPRFRHINNLPIMWEVNVLNLDEVVRTRTEIEANVFHENAPASAGAGVQSAPTQGTSN